MNITYGSSPIVTEHRKPQLSKPVSGKPRKRVEYSPNSNRPLMQQNDRNHRKKSKEPKTGIESYLDGVEAQMQEKGRIQLIPTAMRGPRIQAAPQPQPHPMPFTPLYPFVSLAPGMSMSFQQPPPLPPQQFYAEPPRKKRKLNDGFRYSLASIGIAEDDIPQKLHALNNLPKIRHGDDRRRDLKREIKRELEALDKAGKKGTTVTDMFPVQTKTGTVTQKVEKLTPARIKAIKLSAELATVPINPFLRTDRDERVIEKFPRVLPLHQKARALATIQHLNDNLGFKTTSFVQGAALKSVDDTATKLSNFVIGETIVPGDDSKKEDETEEVANKKYDRSWNLVGVTNKKFAYSPVSSYGLRMMKSMGFKEGKGLGRNESGMTTFLRHMGQHHSRGIRALGETTAKKASGFASCILCDKVFNSMHSVFQHTTSRRHIQNLSKHPNNRVLRCNPCMIDFSNQSLLRQHYVLVSHDHPGVSGLAAVQKQVQQKKPKIQSKGNGVFQPVVYLEFDHGDKHNFKCEVCGCTQIIGIMQFKDHLKGRRHAKELRKLTEEKREEMVAKIAEDLKYFGQSPPPPKLPAQHAKEQKREKKVQQKQERFSCEICGVLNVVKIQFEAHVVGKKHLKAVRREKQIQMINRAGVDPRSLMVGTRAGKKELLMAQAEYEADLRKRGRNGGSPNTSD